MPDQLRLHSFADLWHPGVFAWLLLLQVAYLLAVGPWRSSFGWGAPVPATRRLWFSLGLWCVYLSEGTPLHLLSEKYLFSAHMLQHTLLTMVVPPLLMAGTPDWAMRPLTRIRPLMRAMRLLTRAVPALLVFNVIYSVWHVPVAYEAVLKSHTFHMFQHAVLFTTAILMWWPIASPLPELPPLHEGIQMLYIFVVGVTQLGAFALITFADEPIYKFYENAPRVWAAVDPLADQQIAGVIMNILPMLIAVAVWTVMFFRWASREGTPDLEQPTSKKAVPESGRSLDQ